MKYQYLCVGHHESYSDEPGSNNTPRSVRWFHSIDNGGNLSTATKRHAPKFIDQWRGKCANTNVFRSLSLFTAKQGGGKLQGPFVIDIDREDYVSGKGYRQNLDDALEATRQLVREYLRGLQESDFRVFFTGHKGFNIEVRPQALGITCTRNRQQQFEHRRNYINGFFGNSFVDKIHEWVRLHNSVNNWIGNNGKEVYRMKFELSLYQLNSMCVDEICTESQTLASEFLQKFGFSSCSYR